MQDIQEGGNRTIQQIAEIASKHRMKLFIPSTAYIGAAETMNSKDKLIYTDPSTLKLVVRRGAIEINTLRNFIDTYMYGKVATPADLGERKRKPKEEGVMPPKFVLKLIPKYASNATTKVFFSKSHLISAVLENWGKEDLVVQQFVAPKTLQPAVYRFYRNQRNVYKAECIISKKSMVSDAAICSVFAELYLEAVEEKSKEGTQFTNARVIRNNLMAKSKVAQVLENKLSFLPFPMAMIGMQTPTPNLANGFQNVKNLNTCKSAISGINVAQYTAGGPSTTKHAQRAGNQTATNDKKRSLSNTRPQSAAHQTKQYFNTPQQQKKKVVSAKEQKEIEQLFFYKVHQRYNDNILNGFFTVDAYDETGEESMVVKCMPTSYPNAVSSIDTIYKVFQQMYIDSAKNGMIKDFVCDFMQDSNGRFNFMKIHDFVCDGKPSFSHEWKLSKQYVDVDKQKQEKLIADQVCQAKIICQDKVSSRMLEKSCRKAEFWSTSDIYGKVVQKNLTKYQMEVKLGQDSLSMSVDNKFDVSPFYPLCSFPQRSDQKWTDFERRMQRAESQTGFQDANQSFAARDSINPHSELEKALMASAGPTVNDPRTAIQRRATMATKNTFKLDNNLKTTMDRFSTDPGRRNTLMISRRPTTKRFAQGSGGYDGELSNTELSACHSCKKLVELFKSRHRTITFPSSDVKACLDGLKLTKKAHWDQSDLDYLVMLYKTGEKRQQQIFEDIDQMEKKINNRELKKRIKDNRIQFKRDVKRKTISCKRREYVNLQFKKAVDFENVVGQAAKLQRTGDTDIMTIKDRSKLRNGSLNQKHQYERYGLSLEKGQKSNRQMKTRAQLSKAISDLVVDPPFEDPVGDPVTDPASDQIIIPLQQMQEIERDIKSKSIFESSCDETDQTVDAFNQYGQSSQIKTNEINTYSDQKQDTKMSSEQKQVAMVQQQMAIMKKRLAKSTQKTRSNRLSPARTFDSQRDSKVPTQSNSNRASANPRIVSFEQTLVKNRIRPMTGHLDRRSSNNDMKQSASQSHFQNLCNQQRVPSANLAIPYSSAKALITEFSSPSKIYGKKQQNSSAKPKRKTSAQGRDQEYRLVYQKNSSGMKSSNVLQSLMNQNITQGVAMTPYAKEMQNCGLKLMPVKRDQASTGFKDRFKRRPSSAFGRGGLDTNEIEQASTQPPRTDLEVRDEDNPSGSQKTLSKMYSSQMHFGSGGLDNYRQTSMDEITEFGEQATDKLAKRPSHGRSSTKRTKKLLKIADTERSKFASNLNIHSEQSRLSKAYSHKVMPMVDQMNAPPLVVNNFFLSNNQFQNMAHFGSMMQDQIVNEQQRQMQMELREKRVQASAPGRHRVKKLKKVVRLKQQPFETQDAAIYSAANAAHQNQNQPVNNFTENLESIQLQHQFNGQQLQFHQAQQLEQDDDIDEDEDDVEDLTSQKGEGTTQENEEIYTAI